MRSFCRTKKNHIHEIPPFREGGGLEGGSADIYFFMGARIFLICQAGLLSFTSAQYVRATMFVSFSPGFEGPARSF